MARATQHLRWTWPMQPRTKHVPRDAHLQRRHIGPLGTVTIELHPGSWTGTCSELAARIQSAGSRQDWLLVDPYRQGAGSPGILPSWGDDESPTEVLDGLLGAWERGDLTADRYTNGLGRLTVGAPLYIDGWAHLGNDFLRQAAVDSNEDDREALLTTARSLFATGIGIGQTALDEGFGDCLSNLSLENRPFHRCLHGLIIANYRLGSHTDASTLAEASLWLDPHDRGRHRYVLEFLNAGKEWDAFAAWDGEWHTG